MCSPKKKDWLAGEQAFAQALSRQEANQNWLEVYLGAGLWDFVMVCIRHYFQRSLRIAPPLPQGFPESEFWSKDRATHQYKQVGSDGALKGEHS